MGKVTVGATVSLDGFIAGRNAGFAHLFAWFAGGDHEFPSAATRRQSPTSHR